jgi:adenosine deaminase CECR1
MIEGLFSYEFAFKAYTRFPSNALVKDDGIGYINNKSLLQIIKDEIKYPKKARRCFRGMKVIYCSPRSFSNKAVEDMSRVAAGAE